MNIMALRGAIAERYKTQSAFAKAIGWSDNKVSRLMTGKHSPDMEEISEITRALDLSKERYIDIFYLPIASTNGDEKQKGAVHERY